MTRPRDEYPRTRLTGAFERRVKAALSSHVAPDTPVVIACSGGPDSSAALVAVARTHPGLVIAAHFDHGMRSEVEAETERAVVCRLANDLVVPLLNGRAARPARGEAAARMARYRWLASACAKSSASVCVTGHTRDDQAETVLLRLARGSGGRGAAGMASEASWPVATPASAVLRLVRPLLEIGRVDVEAYLDALGVMAAHDASNDSDVYARNRVRHQVLPALREVNAQAAEHLAAFADRQRSDDEALTAWAGGWLQEHGSTNADVVRLPRKALEALPVAVRARVLLGAGERVALRLGGAHLEAVVRLLAGSGGGSVRAGGGVVTRRGTILELRRDA